MCEPRCEIGTQASDKCVVKSVARKAKGVRREKQIGSLIFFEDLGVCQLIHKLKALGDGPVCREVSCLSCQIGV